MNYPLPWAVPMLALALLGAGCGSSSSSTPNAVNTFPAIMDDESSKVPSDIPTYPGGFVITVTGNARTIHVAQSTPDASERVVEWVKAEFMRRGTTLKQTSQDGFSTNLIFENSANTYITRVDAPKDGGAFLTITREPKDAATGE